MSTSDFIKLVFFSLLAVGLSVLATQRIYLWTINYRIDGIGMPMEITTQQIARLFIICLVYFLLLLVLPLLAKPVIARKKWSRAKFPALIFVLEAVLLICVLGSVPYDTISILSCFVFFQPIAVVNGIVWYRALRVAE